MPPPKPSPLRNRLIGRLTTPAEILLALTRHWAALGTCVAVGTIFMLGKVVTDVPFFEGKAKILITPGDPVMAELGSSSPMSMRRDEFAGYVASRISIFQGETVLRRLVAAIDPRTVLEQGENPSEAEYRGLRKLAQAVRKKLSDAIEYLEAPDFRDTADEALMQRALREFRERSAAIPDAKSGTVQLLVYGIEPKRVELELRTWILETRRYIEEMTREARDPFIAAGVDVYRKEETLAEEALRSTRARLQKEVEGVEGPMADVSPQTVELLMKRAGDLELRLNQLRAQRDGASYGGMTGSGGTGLQDPVQDAILKRKQELEVELVKTKAYHGETSSTIRGIREQIADCDAQLAGLRPSGSDKPAEWKSLVEKRIQDEEAALVVIYKRYGVLKRALETLDEYESKVKLAREWRQSFERLSTLQYVRAGTPGTIQELDKPSVSWKPVNAYPQVKVAYGAAGGLGVGILLAILIELLNPRVRFRADVVRELLDVPVVGVLRKH